jgi:hypothetical protein
MGRVGDMAGAKKKSYKWKAKSLVTESEPGLTKGRTYKVVEVGFYQGGYWTLEKNDHGERIAISDPEKYLKVVQNREGG